MSQFADDLTKSYKEPKSNGVQESPIFSDRDLTPTDVLQGCNEITPEACSSSRVSQFLSVNVGTSNRGMNDPAFAWRSETSEKSPGADPDVTSGDAGLNGTKPVGGR